MAAHPALATLALASHVSFFSLVSKLSPISFLGTDGHSDEHHGFSLHLFLHDCLPRLPPGA